MLSVIKTWSREEQRKTVSWAMKLGRELRADGKDSEAADAEKLAEQVAEMLNATR